MKIGSSHTNFGTGLGRVGDRAGVKAKEHFATLVKDARQIRFREQIKRELGIDLPSYHMLR